MFKRANAQTSKRSNRSRPSNRNMKIEACQLEGKDKKLAARASRRVENQQNQHVTL